VTLPGCQPSIKPDAMQTRSASRVGINIGPITNIDGSGWLRLHGPASNVEYFFGRFRETAFVGQD
jgi:hypothetical protein